MAIKNGKQTEINIAVLKERLNEVGNNLGKHQNDEAAIWGEFRAKLDRLQDDVSQLKIRMAYWGGGIIVIVTVAQVLFQSYLK